MLTLGLFRYAATWGTVAFLLPTEIFPSDLRAQGNGFGITGWAIGVGMTTLVNPIMFATMTVSYISDPVIEEADLYHTEPHLLPLRRSQLDLDPHNLPLYVDATTKNIDGLELIMVSLPRNPQPLLGIHRSTVFHTESLLLEDGAGV